MMNRTTAKKREPPEKAALFLSLPFKGEELCSIGRPVDGRRTLLGLGLLLHQQLHNDLGAIGNRGAGAEDGGNTGFVEEKRS